MNLKEAPGDVEFFHDISMVIEGYKYQYHTGLVPDIESIAYQRDSFRIDVGKFSKIVARQRSYLEGGQED